VFSHNLGHQFQSAEELAKYARERGDEFLKRVDEKGLFIVPGEDGPRQNINDALKQYLEEVSIWRDSKLMKQYESLTPAEIVMQGVCERLVPQYHLLENAEELHAHPLLSLNNHWRYFKICSEAFEGRLLKQDLLKPQTVSVIRALGMPQLQWLGNVPVSALVELRKDNQNEKFRKALSTFTGELHESRLEDIDRVSSEVSRGIASLLVEHQTDLKAIEHKYKSRHAQTAVSAWTTLAASFLPALAPFVVPSVAATLIGKYGSDKVEQRRDLKQLSNSLTGVLASAQNK
jgi:hypothetical protein